MVLRADEGGGGTEEGSPREAGHTQPHPVLGGGLVCPLRVPALPTGLECLHSLAGKRAGREALAGGTPGHAGALRPAPVRPSPIFPPSSHSWLDVPTAGPAQGRKDLGRLAKAPDTLAPACHSFTVGIWGLAWWAPGPGSLWGCMLF